MMATDHAELDLVQALADGELPEEHAETLRTHVTGCDGCQRELDDILQLKLLQPRRAATELQAARRDREPAPGSTRSTATSSAPRPKRAGPRWERPVAYGALAVAACALFLLSIHSSAARRDEDQIRRALSAQHQSADEAQKLADAARRQLLQEQQVRSGLEQELARLKQPQAGLPVLALRTSRGAASAPTLKLAPSAEFFVLQVEREDPARFELYQAELRASDGRVIWRGEKLTPASRDQLAVAFQRSSVPPGDYTLLLEGLGQDGKARRIGSYAFSVAFLN